MDGDLVLMMGRVSLLVYARPNFNHTPITSRRRMIGDGVEPEPAGVEWRRWAQTRSITSTQVITYVYDNANRMTQVGGVNYTWDNNGNLLNAGSSPYRYDQANRLISTTLSGATSLFNYNGDGVRLKQVIAGIPTTYTQDLAAPLPVVLQAKTGTTTAKYICTLGTRPLAQNSTAWEYFLPDALGSVR